MIRGSTPTHTFNLSIDTSTIKRLRLTYVQYGNMLEKTEDDVTISEGKISYTLTQEESLAFSENSTVGIQIKILTNVGTVLVSPVMTLTIEQAYNTEVLT